VKISKKSPKKCPKNAQNAKKEKIIGVQKAPKKISSIFGHLQKSLKKRAKDFRVIFWSQGTFKIANSV